MSIFLGVRPGGRNSFAVSALYCTGHLPGRLIFTKACTGVQEVLDHILGVAGEWGSLTAGAIDAPLSWSASPTGKRKSGTVLRDKMPPWVPKSWFRSPNATPGSIAIQGPALTWQLAYETKHGGMPKHDIFETHPRASMTLAMRDLKESILCYRNAKCSKETQHKHVAKILEKLVDTGVVALDVAAPTKAPELDALVAAVTALGASLPQTGLVVHRFPGGDIRPVGTRSLVVLHGLP